MTKHDLRRRMQTRRSSITDTDKQLANESICKQAKAHPLIINASVIASYQALTHEINPASLTHNISNKQWLYPRVEGKLLVFATITPEHPAKENKFGVLEPTHPDITPLEAIDVMLIPLLAFDEKYYRLGYGGGYYDRTLAKAGKRPILIGLAYEWQKVKELPRDAWDIPLDDVIIA